MTLPIICDSPIRHTPLSWQDATCYSAFPWNHLDDGHLHAVIRR